MTVRTVTLLTVIIVTMPLSARAANDIEVGDVIIDAPTICCLGFSVPIIAGDDDYDATGMIEFRQVGSTAWSRGLDLLRVRPEYTSTETTPGRYGLPVPAEQFAGSLFGLNPGTDYEVRISIEDPDGGSRVQNVAATTRDLPRTDPAEPRHVAVATDVELNNAIAAAQPGDVIKLAAGIYDGPITIDASGTLSNPIIVRGESTDTVTMRQAAPPMA